MLRPPGAPGSIATGTAEEARPARFDDPVLARAAWSSDEFPTGRSYSRPWPPTRRRRVSAAGYRAYESNNRELIESLLADELTFYSPPDPGIDREQYFERCWPNAAMIDSFDFVRLIEAGDEVIVTYESTKTDGCRFRNTEVLRFEGDKIRQVEVYFGWDLA